MLKTALRFMCTVLILGDILGVAFAAERKPLDEDIPLLGFSKKSKTLNKDHVVLDLDKRSEDYKNRVYALHADFIEFRNISFKDKEQSQEAKGLLIGEYRKLRGIYVEDRMLETHLQIEQRTWNTLIEVQKGLRLNTFLDNPIDNCRKFITRKFGDTAQSG